MVNSIRVRWIRLGSHSASKLVSWAMKGVSGLPRKRQGINSGKSHCYNSHLQPCWLMEDEGFIILDVCVCLSGLRGTGEFTSLLYKVFSMLWPWGKWSHAPPMGQMIPCFSHEVNMRHMIHAPLMRQTWGKWSMLLSWGKHEANDPCSSHEANNPMPWSKCPNAFPLPWGT